ncbi:hypothetical protein LUZ63_015764 [Rhynchospora breviuscula]|uniref:Uncharacterized protein n=1 Tax=Rhynchospora breviuscula TaxID=2022672 RepID=A0A9Q0CDN4_9POAL|nr:hypothetical protein LUZ63_015764 [Rhynchospora breviuscula]
MDKFTKLSLAMLALMLAISMVAEARDLKAAKPADDANVKPQTFPPFDRIFPNPTLGGGSSFGMPRFGLGGSSPLGGSSSLPGFSWPGFGTPSGHAATNQEKP